MSITRLSSVGAGSDAPGRGADVVPLYHRVYVVLLQKLTEGSFPLGVSMPSEDDLAERFSVSRVTIRRAMERLEREGLVLRQRGRGTFPLAPARGAEEGAGRRLINQISLSLKTHVEILDYAMARPPAAVAAVFGAGAPEEALRIIRIRGDARSPISHTVCYVIAELAALLPREGLGSLPVSATLAAAGVKLTRFQERITATLADSDIARHLGVEVGTPLIAMTRVVRGADDRVIEHLQALYRPDRYEYRVEYSSADHPHGGQWQAMITDSGA